MFSELSMAILVLRLMLEMRFGEFLPMMKPWL
jgi:hypothetical protein